MDWAEFFTIAIAHLLAVASPGPDFAVVLRQSVTYGSRTGIWTSLGVALAILLHVTYCLLGVAVLLAGSPGLFAAARFFAAGYLFLLGWRALRSKASPDSHAATAREQVQGWRSSLYLGFLTNGLNPKATLFFLALFTVVISQQTPLLIQGIYGAYMAVATFCWFATLSLLLGSQKVQQFFKRSGPWFERGMGVVLIALAIQIAFVS